MHINPLTPHIGAEVTGVDLAHVDNRTFAAIHAAFLQHQVLVFRDQHLDRDAHRAFARRFGPLHIHPSKIHLGAAGDPEIFEIRARAGTRFPNGAAWHSDVSCEPVPPLASLLYLKEAPASGGDTLFANMYRAFEQLSAVLQQFLATLSAVHDGRKDLAQYGITPRPDQNYPRAEHPVVVTHPETGRRLLFINQSFTSHIPQLARWESDALLNMLFGYIATTPELTCRVRQTPGTLTLWDNRCTQHHAVADYLGEERYGERISVCAGTAPNH